MATTNIKTIDLYSLLTPANIFRLVCIDERNVKEKNQTNPVNLPGATYSLVDAIKALYRYSEEDAWEMISRVSIPISAHIDDHIDSKHEGLGCGYARLVETVPKKVCAVEAIKSVDRLLRVSERGGEVLHYLEEHQAKMAVLNYKQGFSVDQDELPLLGILSCDIWAAEYYAIYLKQYDNKIDPQAVAKHIEKIFIATVRVLTNQKISRFMRLK
ncbi:MAG: hypothetical protein V1905_01145 [bacterium]